MKSFFIILYLLLFYQLIGFSQTDSTVKIPFEGMDISWMNGQSRVKSPYLNLLDAKGESIITGGLYFDSYYNYNLANPLDNTQTISSSIGRHNEVQVNLASIGVETNYHNMILTDKSNENIFYGARMQSTDGGYSLVINSSNQVNFIGSSFEGTNQRILVMNVSYKNNFIGSFLL